MSSRAARLLALFPLVMVTAAKVWSLSYQSEIARSFDLLDNKKRLISACPQLLFLPYISPATNLDRQGLREHVELPIATVESQLLSSER
jgi:hypothetical protein